MSKILICMGSGGVGKTTVAAALGVRLARMQQRVLVLTIDPSQRLKTTLGLPENGEIVQIHNPLLQLPTKGSLSGAVVNAKSTFDQFVQRAVTSAGLAPEVADKILANKLYIQLSTTLSGSQEFTALEKLYSASTSGEFDWIVLDTPPAHHAVEFLRAPQKLSAIFNDRVAQWFRGATKPKGPTAFLQQIVNSGTTQVLKSLEILTGADFLRELSEFFQNIEVWQSRLEERIASVQRLLVGGDTEFALVTSLESAKLNEAEYFVREVEKGGYKLSQIYVNKAYPEWLDLQIQTDSPSELAELYRQIRDFTNKKLENYAEFETRMEPLCPCRKLPELQDDVSDLVGILRLTDILSHDEVQA